RPARARAPPDDEFRGPRAVASPYSARTPGREIARPASDPFFDKPYEAPQGAPEPAWEQRAAPVARGLSPNIKQKKKVAALFGGKVPETAS
ncbi:MAG: DEAD/DEAH box helicase, partial [Caldimonas sp.]